MKLHITVQGKTFTVRIGDIRARPIQVDVDGDIFEVWPEETLVPAETALPSASRQQVAHPIPQADIGSSEDAADRQPHVILAPIPGVIVEIAVQAGDRVKYGQELCVLEAMKMKNSIRASRDGTIKKVFSSLGDHVHQSQTLVEFEPEGF